MSNSFHRVSRSLRVDKGLSSASALIVAFLLLGAWLFWAFRARITNYEVSDSARLEVASSAYPVQADTSGRLVVSHLTLGNEVHAGDVLLELESKSERLSLEQEAVHRASVEPQLRALREQLSSEGRGRSEEETVLTVSTSGAESQYRQAEAQAALAGEEAARAERLRREGLIPEAEAKRAAADARAKQAAAESAKTGIARLAPELRVRDRSREVRVAQIAVDIAALEAEVSASLATSKRLTYEIERRRLRAPAAGVLSECAPLRPGAHINAGDQVGVIVPRSGLQVIAEFSPEAALGKLQAGQRAIVRLEGFPWAQFGTLTARVSQVAGEIRNGKVRVELAVNAAPRSRIPIQHGLPGSVEVEIERASPALLLLRSAGQALGAR
jgi:multidrug resistance efflux pump